MLDNKNVLDRLVSLCQLDIDATRAYQQAIENCTHTEVKNQLSTFKADHERHIVDLSAMIRTLGGSPPERKPDFKGFLLEGFTAIRSATGTPGALRAMDTNEMLTNSRYKAALGLDLPDNVRSLVNKNYLDEVRHLQWIRDAIQNRVWEREEGLHP